MIEFTFVSWLKYLTYSALLLFSEYNPGQKCVSCTSVESNNPLIFWVSNISPYAKGL